MPAQNTDQLWLSVPLTFRLQLTGTVRSLIEAELLYAPDGREVSEEVLNQHFSVAHPDEWRLSARKVFQLKKRAVPQPFMIEFCQSEALRRCQLVAQECLRKGVGRASVNTYRVNGYGQVITDYVGSLTSPEQHLIAGEPNWEIDS